mgnify:CR=1 FL=1
MPKAFKTKSACWMFCTYRIPWSLKRLRKDWLLALMVKAKLGLGTAPIARSSAKKLIQKAMKDLPDTLAPQSGSSDPDPALVDVLNFQFYQVSEAKTDIKLSPDYGLVDVKLTVEGNYFIFGVDRHYVPGSDMQT